MIVLKLIMDSVVIKRVSIVSILLNTLIWWVRLDELFNFLLKICFFLIYVSCLHMCLWTLCSLILTHLIIIWSIICITCSWRWRMMNLSNWIVPIPLKDRKFKHLVFESILLVLIIVANFGDDTWILFIAFTISISNWWCRL